MRDGYAYRGGHRDSLGRDDGTRAFPAGLQAALGSYDGSVNPTQILAGLNRDGNFHFLREAEAINRDLAVSLNRDVGLEKKSLGPDGSVELALGNRWFFSEDDAWRFGAMGLFSYDNTLAQPRAHRARRRRSSDPRREQVSDDQPGLGDGRLEPRPELYRPIMRSRRTASSFATPRTRRAIATRTNNNFQRADGRQLRDYDLRYEQRELLANQIRGHHVIGQDTRESIAQLDKDWLDGLTFDWYSSDSTAETDIPNEIKFSAEDTIDPATGDLHLDGDPPVELGRRLSVHVPRGRGSQLAAGIS